jgi:hypothetical protein
MKRETRIVKICSSATTLCAPMTPHEPGGARAGDRYRHARSRSTLSPCSTPCGGRGRPQFRSVGGAIKVDEVRPALFTTQDSGGARSCDFNAQNIFRRRKTTTKKRGNNVRTYVPIIPIIFSVFKTFFSNAWLNTTTKMKEGGEEKSKAYHISFVSFIPDSKICS